MIANSKNTEFTNQLKSSEVKNKFVSLESDNFHLFQFCKMKKTKWIYAPFVGTILYFFIFRNFCEVNLIDRKKAYFTRGKLSMILFFPQAFLGMAFVVNLIVLITLSSLSGIETLYKIMYILIPLYAILLLSPFLSFLAEINSKRILKVNKISINEKDIFIYRNAEIFNNKNYFEKLSKNPNHKINEFFLSENFQNINSVPITENYEGTKIQKMKEYSIKQNETINAYWILMPFAFILIWIFRFFDYFFFSNILCQKAKFDNKISLSKKIYWIIFINYLFLIITWAAFILFLVTPLTSFSYFPDSSSFIDLLLPIWLHFIYCFVFLAIFLFISWAKAQITKRLVIKLCLKEYSKNI